MSKLYVFDIKIDFFRAKMAQGARAVKRSARNRIATETQRGKNDVSFFSQFWDSIIL